MKVLITKNTVCNGEVAAIGETVEVSDKDAAYLLALKKAVPAPEPERGAVVETAVAKAPVKKAVSRRIKRSE
jgi:hypothetical protein